MTPAEIGLKAQNRAGDALVRVAAAMVAQKVDRDGLKNHFAKRPDDQISPLLHRAVTTVGTLGGSGWADDLAATAVAQFIVGLGPMSAAAKLFALAYDVPLPQGAATVSVPGVVPVGQAGAFVEELDPIPVTSWNFGAASLGRKKLAILTVITRELAKARGMEAEVRRLLQASAAITLDSVLFSAAAATDAAPAGIFNGVTGITPGTFDSDPMVNDLTSLAAAVQSISGDRLAYVTSPARAVQISMRAPELRYPVLASSAIADSRIAAVALDGFAVSIDPIPDIFVSQEAVLHMSDAPLELVDDAGTKADPVRSVFQTASLAVRLIVEMDWASRDENAVAFIDGLSW